MVFSWGQEHAVSYSFIIATERLANKLPTAAAAAKVTSWVCCVNHGEAINTVSLLQLIMINSLNGTGHFLG